MVQRHEYMRFLQRWTASAGSITNVRDLIMSYALQIVIGILFALPTTS